MKKILLRIKRARKNVMTNRLACSLKVKKIPLRQWGQSIKKDHAATPETSILSFLAFFYKYIKHKKSS